MIFMLISRVGFPRGRGVRCACACYRAASAAARVLQDCAHVTVLWARLRFAAGAQRGLGERGSGRGEGESHAARCLRPRP
mmetsp:Transcript_22157/g.56143  ORF Transcript_22157/g.56143 Transcript_22157/m.56143 type:complete len:80 (-) Transcript_22157:613-852(-)